MSDGQDQSNYPEEYWAYSGTQHAHNQNPVVGHISSYNYAPLEDPVFNAGALMYGENYGAGSAQQSSLPVSSGRSYADCNTQYAVPNETYAQPLDQGQMYPNVQAETWAPPSYMRGRSPEAAQVNTFPPGFRYAGASSPGREVAGGWHTSAGSASWEGNVLSNQPQSGETDSQQSDLEPLSHFVDPPATTSRAHRTRFFNLHPQDFEDSSGSATRMPTALNTGREKSSCTECTVARRECTLPTGAEPDDPCIRCAVRGVQCTYNTSRSVPPVVRPRLGRVGRTQNRCDSCYTAGRLCTHAVFSEP